MRTSSNSTHGSRRWAVAGVLALVVATSCGGDDDDDGAEASTASTPASPARTPAESTATATDTAGDTATAATTEGSAAGGQSSGGGSAVGVTADTVKLGIIIEDYPPDNTTPFFFREDAEDAVAAIVADLNENGGAAGRTIEPVFVHLNVVDPNGPRQACLELTENQEVFAIIGGYAATAANDCFMKDHGTPLIDTNPLSDAANEAYGGLHMTPSPTFDRTAKDWVNGAAELGLFDPAQGFEKLGIVSTSCEADVWDNPETGIKHYLDEIGVTADAISEFRVDCTLESLLAGHEQALLKHNQDGVTTVMIAAQPLDRNYTALAARQGFAPTYTWGDFHWATQAANAQSLNQEAVDGSAGVTAFRQDVDAPAAQKCSETIVAAGLPALEAIQSDLLIMNYCTMLNIFQKVADAAGTDLTRESFVAAAPTVGAIDSAVELSVDFDGDTSGGEQFQVVTWNASETAWLPEGEPQPSTFP